MTEWPGPGAQRSDHGGPGDDARVLRWSADAPQARRAQLGREAEALVRSGLVWPT
jgi:hypothetical protein